MFGGLFTYNQNPEGYIIKACSLSPMNLIEYLYVNLNETCYELNYCKFSSKSFQVFKSLSNTMRRPLLMIPILINKLITIFLRFNGDKRRTFSRALLSC